MASVPHCQATRGIENKKKAQFSKSQSNHAAEALPYHAKYTACYLILPGIKLTQSQNYDASLT
jgi:hypothetical protein